jgi:hypothetical protein
LLLLPAVPRAASALLDPSSKAAATKMENVRFIRLTSIMCCQRNEGVLGRWWLRLLTPLEANSEKKPQRMAVAPCFVVSERKSRKSKNRETSAQPELD